MKKKSSKPAGAKPASRSRRSRKIAPPRARGSRRAETLDPPNTTQQARTLIAKAKFLIDFALCGNVLRSAAAAGVNRRTIYGWLKTDPKFKDLFEAAHDDALDRLEEEARRRAVEGVLEPVVSAGALICHVRKYSDALLITLLKGKRPDTFRERHEVMGKNGGPITTAAVAAAMSDGELKAALQEALEALP